MHLIFKLILVMCATAAFLWSLPLEHISFSSKESTPLAAEHCDCDSGKSEAVESRSLTPVTTPSNMVCVDKYAPVLFYPLPIPDLRNLVLKLLHGERVAVQPINDHYSSIRFPNVSLYFDQRPKGLLILIKSSPRNMENRKVYRSTWANPNYLSKFDIPIAYAFLIGTGQYFGAIPAALSTESKENRDIVFQDFVDTYRNLTYKTMGGLKWVLQSCPEFEFLVSVDDDMYFSVEQAVLLLKSPKDYGVSVDHSETLPSPSKFGFKIHPETYFLAGRKLGGQNSVIPRNPLDKKWYISWEDYPLEQFPFFPYGGTIFFSRRTVREIYTASRFVKHMMAEDVYVGIVAAKLDIPPTDITAHIINDHKFVKNAFVSKKNLISGHVSGHLHEMRRGLWHELHDKD